MFDSITFLLFHNSNQSFNDQNTYSDELRKGCVKLLERNLHDSNPTNVQNLKIFVINKFVNHVNMSQTPTIEEYIEKMAISSMKGGIWGDSIIQDICHNL